jgi:ferritin-like metal-binding protein YciE
MDAALVGAAQRVEHYEIAAYGTVCEFANELGETQQGSLLTKTPEEERNGRKAHATGGEDQSAG